MAGKPNTFLRILVPSVLLLGSIGLFWASAKSKPPSAANPPAGAAPTMGVPKPAAAAPAALGGANAEKPTTPPPPPATPPAANAVEQASTAPSQPASIPTAPAAPPVARSLSVKPAPNSTTLTPLGDLKPVKDGGTYRMKIEFAPVGAGIEKITLADHFTRVGPNPPNEVVLQRIAFDYPLYDASGNIASVRTRTLVPFSLLGVFIDTEFVNLAASASGEPVWSEIAPGHFQAEIVDASGATQARVHRQFTLPMVGTSSATGSVGAVGSVEGYTITLEQWLENLTDRPMQVIWHQMGPTDAPFDATYGGDMRRARLGYIAGPGPDPDQQFVIGGTRFLIEHPALMGAMDWDAASGSYAFKEKTIWPDPATVTESLSIGWAALTSRYFAVAVLAVPDAQPARTDTPARNVLDKRLHAAGTIDRLGLGPATANQSEFTAQARQALKLVSVPVVAAPGKRAALPVAIYAGPMSNRFLDTPGPAKQTGLAGLEIYYYGGPCGWCTFQPIANLLHGYLTLVHDWFLRDWALSIILLVLTVRTILHPVTRWSQRNMTKFGKQMAALAPKQAKLKEKFGSDPQRLREEVAKLMKEENVNYTGALGCLPAFLQTPIWIALYAMIAFNFELRHSPAFFGVFQGLGNLTGNFWPFLADLSVEDRFIPLPFELNLVMFKVSSINLLPFLLGAVFYVQQKYLAPPQSAQMTPEQEQQQKIVKVMMVVLFPLMMYNAPAALSLYFIANSALGSIEAKWVRKGLEAEEELAKLRGGEAGSSGSGASAAARGRKPVDTAKPPGFFERIRLAVEQAQKIKAEQQRKQDKGRSR